MERYNPAPLPGELGRIDYIEKEIALLEKTCNSSYLNCDAQYIANLKELNRLYKERIEHNDKSSK
jgi:hypothetical protein